MVTVVAHVDGGEYVVHDAGFGAMYLTSAGVRVTKQLSHRFAQLAAHYGCQFVGNRMTRRCTPEQVAMAAALVANASRSIGDQALEIKRQSENDFRTAVAERLREVAGTRVRENQEARGASGRVYRIPNVLLDKAERSPVAFIVGLPNRSLVLPHVAEFFDLQNAHRDVANDAIYDETADFRPEDHRLLNQVGEAIAFGQTKLKFAQLVAAA
jgi:hypothetical protein